MILGVTGFVPIPDHPRSVHEYEQLGERLLEADIPLMRVDATLEQCWLWRYLKGKKYTWSTADNPRKNSIAYHCVMAQKSELLSIVAEKIVPDVLVWIDFGIFHIPGMTQGILRDFMQRAQHERAIAIPGCWDRNYEYDDRYPMWRWCGGLIVMPRKHVDIFDLAMKEEYKRHLQVTGNVSWEVNTLCRVEKYFPSLPLWHYKANHDASMFVNYKPVEAQMQ